MKALINLNQEGACQVPSSNLEVSQQILNFNFGTVLDLMDNNKSLKITFILGLLGVISAVLATIAALGTMMYCGMPFIGINLAAPFLMLGIGIDDTFVMLGAWRRTSLHAPVPERMRETFKDAAVSITITSVTDMLSFFVGVITPFPCVKIFCVYTGKHIPMHL